MDNNETKRLMNEILSLETALETKYIETKEYYNNIFDHYSNQMDAFRHDLQVDFHYISKIKNNECDLDAVNLKLLLHSIKQELSYDLKEVNKSYLTLK